LARAEADGKEVHDGLERNGAFVAARSRHASAFTLDACARFADPAAMATFPPLLRRIIGAFASCVAAMLLLQAVVFATPRGPMGAGGWAPACAADGRGADHAPVDTGSGCASLACCAAARPIAFGEAVPGLLARPPRVAQSPRLVAEVAPDARMRRPWSSRGPPRG
jgi:hypothetical protein